MSSWVYKQEVATVIGIEDDSEVKIANLEFDGGKTLNVDSRQLSSLTIPFKQVQVGMKFAFTTLVDKIEEFNV